MRVFDSFTFLKDINPIWYFNLYPERAETFSTAYYNSSAVKIPDEYFNLLKEDLRYSNRASREIDLGYRLWNCGVMLTADEVAPEKFLHSERPNTLDNYIFVRKYYKWHRVYYFLAKSILLLKNPLTEISAFLKTRDVKNVSLTDPHCEYEEYKDFNSKLIKSQPLVSIIIPTLNRYKYLRDVIEDLGKQSYRKTEIIIVDQTDNPDMEFYKQFDEGIKVIYQHGKGQWLARNEAIRNSAGEWLLFFDDDSRVDADWVSEHLKSVDFLKRIFQRAYQYRK